MQIAPKSNSFELVSIIVNFGLGSDIIKFSKQHEIIGGTIFFGKGTIKNAFLEFLDMAETRKEIVIMAVESTIANTFLEELNKKFKFCKPHHGIAFTTSITGISGATCHTYKLNKGVENPMYNVITTVVAKGKGEDVIDAATKVGSKGGTIVNARGAGTNETSSLFSMIIEPERELVLILSESSLTEKIVSSIKEALHMDCPGNGVIFVQDVNKAYGLY